MVCYANCRVRRSGPLLVYFVFVPTPLFSYFLMTQTPKTPIGSHGPAPASEPQNIKLGELKPLRLVIVVIVWLGLALIVPSTSKEFLGLTGVLVLVAASFPVRSPR